VRIRDRIEMKDTVTILRNINKKLRDLQDHIMSCENDFDKILEEGNGIIDSFFNSALMRDLSSAGDKVRRFKEILEYGLIL